MQHHFCSSTVHRIEAIPELKAFHAEVSAVLGAGNPEAFWSLEPLFKSFVSSSTCVDVLAHDLKQCAENTSFAPHMASSNRLPIVRTDLYSLELGILRSSEELPKVLHTVTEHQFLTSITSSPLEVLLYEADQPRVNDLFDAGVSLGPPMRIRLDPYEILRLKADRSVFLPIPGETPVVYVHCATSPLVPLKWEFERSSGRASSMIAADSQSCRLEYAVRVLAEFGDKRSLDSLVGLLEHPYHFVRWTAMQSILAIDPEFGVEKVANLLTDPHPHVREAAKEVLQLAATLITSEGEQNGAHA